MELNKSTKSTLDDMHSKLFSFFPIHRHEYAKFFLLAFLCFCVCTNYTLLRTVKETLVITKPEMGLEIIPFLRTWMLMPIMLLFVKVYALLSSRLKQSQVCYTLVLFFLFYFLLFVFLLYPYDEFFQLTSISAAFEKLSIPFAAQMGAILRHWSFSIYYCLSEVWGTLVVLILFWGASNRLNTVEEAKRYYSPILFIANLSGFFASQVCLNLSSGSYKYLFFPGYDKWAATFLSITLIVSIITLLILFLFYFLFNNFNVGADSAARDAPLSKKKMSLFEMVKSIKNNKNILLLAVMVFAYFFNSGIMEITWKFYLQKTYPNPNDFNDYLSYCTQYISIASLLLALTVTGSLIRRFPWRVSAMIMPILLLIPMLGFVILCYFFDSNPAIATLLGAAYYCLNRICKFTFFDLSKEVATVEFSYEEQIKSKAVLDGLLPKLGKTCESVTLQVLLVTAGSFSLFTPPLMIFLFAIHLVWIYIIAEKKPKLSTQVLTSAIE